MPVVSPVVYNQSVLQFWREELLQLQDRKLPLKCLIDSLKQQLEPLQRKFDEVTRLISAVEIERAHATIYATQDRFNHTHTHHHQDRFNHMHAHHHQDRFNHMHAHHHPTHLDDVCRTQLLRNLQAERSLLLEQMRPCKLQLNEACIEFDRFCSRDLFLNKHIAAAESFLRLLQENPEKLEVDLVNKLQQAFNEYEDTHFIDLSPQVRISLIAVRYGLNKLRYEDGGEYYPRASYLRLCGFIWDMYFKVEKENQDSQFEELLARLAESTHVLQDGCLPDDLNGPCHAVSAEVVFRYFQVKYPEYFAIQAGNLLTIEKTIFKDGWNVFNLQQERSLQKSVANALRIEIAAKRHKNHPIDYHFYGRIVRVLSDVFAKPSDVQVAKRLGKLAEHVSGSPSVGRQVLGGLVMVFGILLIGASIVGLVATFGLNSPLSALGMAWGLSLFQTQIVLGVMSTLAAASGIGLTFFAGLRAVKSGQRQGLSQALIDVKERARLDDKRIHVGEYEDASQSCSVASH